MIYNEDCLDTLNRNLDYDYIITSPPDFDEIGADTKNINPYVEFLKSRFEKFNPNGNVVTIFVSDRKAEGTVIQKHNIICELMKYCGWDLKSQKVWVKKEDTIDMYRHGYTFILTFSRGSVKHPLLPDVFSEKFIPATPEYTYNFSPNIVKQFINVYTKKSQIVFDPFMGSGTTAMVCVENNREYIGSEIIESTCKIAENRINKIKNADKFFKL
jgi:site-specific DNA-methyltransferase (adenine-specific)/modification methylase